MEKLLRNYKAAALPLGVSIILLVLTIIVSNFLIGRINLTRTETGRIEKSVESLEARVAMLQAAAGSVRDSVNTAALAIPETNPSVLITRQLRQQASEKGILLEDYSIVSPLPVEESPLQNYEISFNASGSDYQVVSDFIAGLSKLLPLVNISSVSISESNQTNSIEAEVRLVAYSAPLPLSLPSLDDPLTGLSLAEQESLALLESFGKPSLVSGGAESVEIVPRENPFRLDL